MINWMKAQQRLGVPTDGNPGRTTYGALFKFMASTVATAAVINSLANAAVVHFPTYGINQSADRLADFLAQTGNETGGYTRFEENLRYSAQRLCAVWPNRFPNLASAMPYAWDPNDPDREDQALANLVYGSRMGNQVNGTADDDGWDHRGRGMAQLTGLDNYVATDRRLGIGLDTNPELASVPALSLLIACDFYRENKILIALDAKNFPKARELMNGGQIGLPEVNSLRARAMTVLG